MQRSLYIVKEETNVNLLYIGTDANWPEGLRLFSSDDDFTEWKHTIEASNNTQIACEVLNTNSVNEVRKLLSNKLVNVVVIESGFEQFYQIIDLMVKNHPFVPFNFLCEESFSYDQYRHKGKLEYSPYHIWKKEKTYPGEILKGAVQSALDLNKSHLRVIKAENVIYKAAIDYLHQDEQGNIIFEEFRAESRIEARRKAIAFLRANTKPDDAYSLEIHPESGEKDFMVTIENPMFKTPNEEMMSKHFEYKLYIHKGFDVKDDVITGRSGHFTFPILKSVWHDSEEG